MVAKLYREEVYSTAVPIEGGRRVFRHIGIHFGVERSMQICNIQTNWRYSSGGKGCLYITMSVRFMLSFAISLLTFRITSFPCTYLHLFVPIHLFAFTWLHSLGCTTYICINSQTQKGRYNLYAFTCVHSLVCIHLQVLNWLQNMIAFT